MRLEKIACKILIKVAEKASSPEEKDKQQRTWGQFFKDYRPLITDALEEGTEAVIRLTAKKGAH